MEPIGDLYKTNVYELARYLEVPEEITALCEARIAAKKDKNYALADSLRAEITAKGYIVKDTKEGYTVEKA